MSTEGDRARKETLGGLEVDAEKSFHKEEKHSACSKGGKKE